MGGVIPSVLEKMLSRELGRPAAVHDDMQREAGLLRDVLSFKGE